MKKEAEQQLQVEMLVTRINEVDEKKNEFKNELIKVKNENIEISRERANIEMDIEDMNQ